LEQENINNFLEIHTYLTGQLSVDEIRTIMYGVDQGKTITNTKITNKHEHNNKQA